MAASSFGGLTSVLAALISKCAAFSSSGTGGNWKSSMVTGWPAAEQAYSLVPALLNVLRWLTVGRTLPPAQSQVALAGAGLLLAMSLWPRKGGWFGVTSLAFYLLLPVGFIFTFNLFQTLNV